MAKTNMGKMPMSKSEMEKMMRDMMTKMIKKMGMKDKMKNGKSKARKRS